MTKPLLYVFAISHYCEKARWALEYLEIEHQLQYLAPGPHITTAKKLGLANSAVPYLHTQGETIQGSSAIIDWAREHTASARQLEPNVDQDVCAAMEKRLDDALGVHLRRYYYSEALVEHPQTVKPIFVKDLGLLQRAILGLAWGTVRKKMIERMDLGPEQGRDSKAVVAGELDWLDQKLSDGRRFLLGDAFSRVDITAASLLAPLATPDQHPAYANLQLPPGVADDLSHWDQRPAVAWTRKMYRRYRFPGAH